MPAALTRICVSSESELDHQREMAGKGEEDADAKYRQRLLAASDERPEGSAIAARTSALGTNRVTK